MAGFAAGMLVMAAPLAAVTFGPGGSNAEPDDSAASNEPRPAVGHIASVEAAPVAAAVDKAVRTAVTTATGAEAVATTVDRKGHRRIVVERDGQRSVIDDAVEMKVLGVTPEYMESMRQLGGQFRNLTVDDAVEMKVLGVTPEYARAMARAGFPNLSPSTLGEARATGVTPAFVERVRRSGHQIRDIDQLVEMRVLGIDPAHLKYLGGVRPPSPPGVPVPPDPDNDPDVDDDNDE
jgi:hypothetical protein